MLGVDHDKIILLSTPFPTIPMLGKHCSCDVIMFYVGNKRCCIVLYCIGLLLHDNSYPLLVSPSHWQVFSAKLHPVSSNNCRCPHTLSYVLALPLYY